jgi:hypothetical protein
MDIVDIPKYIIVFLYEGDASTPEHQKFGRIRAADKIGLPGVSAIKNYGKVQ